MHPKYCLLPLFAVPIAAVQDGPSEQPNESDKLDRERCERRRRVDEQIRRLQKIVIKNQVAHNGELNWWGQISRYLAEFWQEQLELRPDLYACDETFQEPPLAWSEVTDGQSIDEDLVYRDGYISITIPASVTSSETAGRVTSLAEL